MRLLQPKDDQTAIEIPNPVSPFPGIEAEYLLDEDDKSKPSYSTMYFVRDIQPVIEDGTFYSNDVKSCATSGCLVSWVVLSFINGRDSDKTADWAKSQVPEESPSPGTIVVVNGSTPRPEMEQDYHDWYEQEHFGKLSLVPGWQLGRRYKLRELYGEAETASIYGVNFYCKVNGLGGPEWRAGVTTWTKRIREQAAKPNVRRVWKVKETRRV